ncbi:MAG: DUF4214 domain-containing protein [Sulfitobacter sp.]
MSFTIEIDYRFDTRGFFDDPARRAAMEDAARAWEIHIRDEFADIPAGQTITGVRDPQVYTVTQDITLTTPIDDVLVFVGATDALPPISPGNEAGARGGPKFGLSGDIYWSRITNDFRNMGPVTDFEPWVGTVSFNAKLDWSDPEKLRETAIHEIGHVLGIGTASAFDIQVRDGAFYGVNAMRINDGAPVPLSSDLSHVEEGFAGNTVSLDPSGGVSVISDVDKALLADIGYEIDGFTKQGTQPAVATQGNEDILGTFIEDRIEALGGDDLVFGRGGEDTLLGGAGDDQLIAGPQDTVLLGGQGNDTLFGEAGNDVLFGGPGDDNLYGSDGQDLFLSLQGNDNLFGDAGIDRFLVVQGGGLRRAPDFDAASETLYVVDGGVSDVSQLLSTATKPFANRVEFSLSDGTTVQVNGTSTGDLSAQNIVLVSPQVGDAGQNGFFSNTGTDFIDAGAGLDTVRFGGTGAQYHIVRGEADELAVRCTASGDWDFLVGVERLVFADGERAFDVDGIAGQAYRLYQAAFDRTPDTPGLGFWIDVLDAGDTTLDDAADFFMTSTEFAETYAPPASQAYDDFLTLLYNNVLDRDPDQAGFAFWQQQQVNGITRAEVLVYFSESVENVAKTADATADGIWFV